MFSICLLLFIFYTFCSDYSFCYSLYKKKPSPLRVSSVSVKNCSFAFISNWKFLVSCGFWSRNLKPAFYHFMILSKPLSDMLHRCWSFVKIASCLRKLLRKKWSFPLRNSSVNVTKSAVSCGFGHIYWRNPEWKTSFLAQRFLGNSC